MKKKGKRERKGIKVQEPDFDSDDERAYTNEKRPDARDEDYYLDAVDSFHSERDKISLEPSDLREEPDEVQEVLPVDESEDDDETIANIKQQLKNLRARGFTEDAVSESDCEESDGADSEEENVAWGKGRQSYFGADDTEARADRYSRDEEASAAALEESEARRIQRHLTAQLDEADLGLEDLAEEQLGAEEHSLLSEQTVVTDIDSLTSAERARMLKQRSPELKGLLKVYKTALMELKDVYLPALQYLDTRDTPERKLHEQLGQCDIQMRKEIDFVLECRKHGRPISFLTQSEPRKKLKPSRVQKRNLKVSELLDTNSDADSDRDHDMDTPVLDGVSQSLSNDVQEAPDDDEEGETKRGITYQIEKNKGLTPKRKKEARNPRVKNRLKYRRKRLARRGQVREVRPALTPYGGELSGIRAGVTRSRKLR